MLLQYEMLFVAYETPSVWFRSQQNNKKDLWQKELKVTSYLRCKQTSARDDSFFTVYIELNIFIYLNFVYILSFSCKNFFTEFEHR